MTSILLIPSSQFSHQLEFAVAFSPLWKFALEVSAFGVLFPRTWASASRLLPLTETQCHCGHSSRHPIRAAAPSGAPAAPPFPFASTCCLDFWPGFFYWRFPSSFSVCSLCVGAFIFCSFFPTIMKLKPGCTEDDAVGRGRTLDSLQHTHTYIYTYRIS